MRLRCAIMAFVLSCSCMNTTSEYIIIQGHRGFRGLWPENTIAGFRAAATEGADILELDVVCTADERIVITHDPFLNHEIWAHPDGTPIRPEEEAGLNIYRMTLDSLRSYKLGTLRHRRFPEQKQVEQSIPDLVGLADSIQPNFQSPSRAGIRYNIEIKSRPEWDSVYHPSPERYVAIFLRELERSGLNCMVQSFDMRILRELHRHRPDLPLAALSESTGHTLDDLIRELGFSPSAYSPHFSMVTPALVAACRRQGIELVVWTVNAEEDLRHMIHLGVKNIITDYPDRARAIRDELAP